MAWTLALAVIVGICGACDRSSSTPPPAPITTVKATPIDPPVARGAMAPNLVAANEDLLLTWLEPVDEARSAHRLRLSRLAHGSWSKPTTITEGAKVVANWADVPSVARQDDGTLVAHWAEKSADGHAYDVVLGRSVDGGTTWRRLGSPHRDGTVTEHGFGALVPDGDATLVLWLDGRATANSAAGATAIRAARIGDTIGEEQVVDDRVCDCCSTAAAITADGPVVVFRDRSADELRDPWIARRIGGSWSASRAVHADGWQIAGCPVNGPALSAVGANVVVAWYTSADRPTIRIAFSANAGATFDRPIDVDAPRGTRTPIGRVDVVIERPDRAIVSWVASERTDGHVLIRRVSRDRRRGSELEIAMITAAREGGFPRMESIGDDVVFAWTDARAGVRAARLQRSQVPALDELVMAPP